MSLCKRPAALRMAPSRPQAFSWRASLLLLRLLLHGLTSGQQFGQGDFGRPHNVRNVESGRIEQRGGGGRRKCCLDCRCNVEIVHGNGTSTSVLQGHVREQHGRKRRATKYNDIGRGQPIFHFVKLKKRVRMIGFVKEQRQWSDRRMTRGTLRQPWYIGPPNGIVLVFLVGIDELRRRQGLRKLIGTRRRRGRGRRSLLVASSTRAAIGGWLWTAVTYGSSSSSGG
jgi:hypothetical protein